MKYDKLMDKWLISPPSSEPIDVVENVLIHYFGNDCLKNKARSSHQYRINDIRPADLPQFAPYGYLSVPVKDGQRVIKVYLQKIAKAVKHIESLEGLEDE